MAREGYTCNITESSKELSPKERIRVKNMGETVQLNKATQAESLKIDFDYYVAMAIHNEHSKDGKDYNSYLVFDKDGTAYSTSSDSFFQSMKDIVEEMAGVNEPWELEVYQKQSKNREGKSFITCGIV